MLRNHVEKSCWARKGFSNAPTSGARRGGDGCSVSNGHFFGRRAEKFLWGTRDTKVSIWWRRGGSSDNQGGENSSSKKATTSKGTLYALFTSMSHWFQIFVRTYCAHDIICALCHICKFNSRKFSHNWLSVTSSCSKCTPPAAYSLTTITLPTTHIVSIILIVVSFQEKHS